MSTTAQVTAINSGYFPSTWSQTVGFDGTAQSENVDNKLIVVEDISEEIVEQHPYLLLSGIALNPAITDDWKQKLIASSILTLFTSTLIKNFFVLQLFVVFSLVNFIVLVLTDKEESIRIKISRLLADLFAVGLVATLAEVAFSSISFLGVSIGQLIAWLMVLTYISNIVKRLYPYLTVSKTPFIAHLALAIRYGIEQSKSKLEELQTSDVLKPENK
jgi:hypothetical protein